MKSQLPDCMICRAPERARLIEADWAEGLTAKGIAARMTAAGWSITPATVLNHLKQHVENASTRQNTPPGMTKRDSATWVRNKIMDAVERREELARIRREKEGEDGEEEPDMFILSKELQPALNTALKAEAIIEKRDNNVAKRQIDVYQLLLGGADGALMLAPRHLIGSGEEEADVIEGEAEEVTTPVDDDGDTEA